MVIDTSLLRNANTAELLENERTTGDEEVSDNETILLVIASLFMFGALLQQLTIVSLAKLIKELLKDREHHDN